MTRGADHFDALSARSGAGAAVEASELDSGLVGIGAAVTEEGTTPKAVPRDGFGDPRLRFGVQQVPRVPKQTRLLSHRFDQCRVAVTQDRGTKTAEQVDVLLAVRVRESAPLATNHRHGIARVVQ